MDNPKWEFNLEAISQGVADGPRPLIFQPLPERAGACYIGRARGPKIHAESAMGNGRSWRSSLSTTEQKQPLCHVLKLLISNRFCWDAWSQIQEMTRKSMT